MDKEQEILQKLEQLRVEQLKALKELKKVEKAKKKQRRRTTHGYPVFPKKESNKNGATTETGVETPARNNSHLMATSSKSCDKDDGARMRAKHAQDLQREKETPNISTSKKYKCTSLKHTAYFNKAVVNDAQQEAIKTEDTEKEPLVTKSAGLSRDNDINVNKIVSKPTTSLDQTPNTSKGKVENYEKEKAKYQEEISAEESNRLSEDNSTVSGKIIAGLESPLDLIPMPRQFTNKTENTSARVLKQKDEENSTATCMLSRKAHDSHKRRSASNGWKKSKISKADSVSDNQASLKKRKQLENAAGSVPGNGSVISRISSMAKDSVNSSTIKRDECTLQDLSSEYITTNMSPSQAEKGVFKKITTPFEDRKEELHPTNSILSTHDKPFECFTQNIFSQSLFDDVFDDQITKDDLSGVCESSIRQGNNNEKNVSKTVTRIMTSNDNDTCEQIYSGEDQKRKSFVNNNRKKQSAEDLSDLGRSASNSLGRGSTDLLPNNAMQSDVTTEIKEAVSYNSSFSIDTSTDILQSNTLQRNDQVSLEENEEKVRANFSSPKTVAGITKLSSKTSHNRLPNIFNAGEKAGDDKFSTNGIKDAPSQQAEVDVPSMSTVSANFAQAEIHGNPSSLVDDFESGFLLQETDWQLGTQEQPSFPLIDNITNAEYNPVSKNVLLKEQAEEMQLELTDDMLADLPQKFTNELEAFDVRSESEKKTIEGKDRKQTNSVQKKYKNLQFFKDGSSSSFEDLLLAQPSLVHSQNPPCEDHFSQECTPIKREICLQHSLNSLGSCNKVRHIKFLTHAVGEGCLDMIAVCLSRLLVLWRAENRCTAWTVMHKWLLEEDEEIIDIEVASVRLCIVLIIGGNFHKALGRVYCVHGENDRKFDIYEEVSFSDLGEIVYGYQKMCLLPYKESNENFNIILASAFEGKIVLTKWTIDLICFCLEDCKDLPEVIGIKMSSFCLVQGSKCLLLGCVDSDLYLWNYNSCELLWRMTLQIGLFTRPVCLSAETNSGIIFLSLLDKDENKVNLVAINPQTSREACLKSFIAVDLIEDDRKKVLHCSKTGHYVLGSFEHGQIFLWNMVTDSKTVFDQKIGDVFCISLHPKDSIVAFGTASGCVYLDVWQKSGH